MGFVFMKPKAVCRTVRKSTESQAVLERLEHFLQQTETGHVRFLARFWEAQAAAVTYGELSRIITEGDVPQDIMDDWFHDYSVLLSERITPAWREAMIAGYSSNPIFEGSGFQFQSSEENVRRWLADRSAEMVTNCCQEQREAIRYLAAEGTNSGMAPAELARYIRPTIGLTERQAAANLRYYQNMKTQLAAEHPRMRPETIETRAREAAARYAGRQHRSRAETIARTELATAYHQGNDAAVRQAMAQDLMPPMRKVWSTSRDDKVCPACAALEGMEIGMDGDFQFTSGRQLVEVTLPPAHPRCACAVMYVEVEQNIARDEVREFEMPDGENLQEYKEVEIDREDTRNDMREDGMVKSHRVISTENEIYASQRVELSRRTLHSIDANITKAMKVLQISGRQNLPVIVIASITEMRSGTLAAYNPYENVLYINEAIGNRKLLLESQKTFAASKKVLATYVHEYIHWIDAENYRKKFQMRQTDEYYLDWINEKCRKHLEKLSGQGYNVNGISRYASKSFKQGEFAETYTEYRVKVILGG